MIETPIGARLSRSINSALVGILYHEILQQYLYHPECKFAGPDGKPCDPWTRGVLQRRHIVAERHIHCGKKFKRKLEQGPVDHELDVKSKVYENERMAADPEMLRLLGQFSESQTSRGTRLHRKPIRIFPARLNSHAKNVRKDRGLPSSPLDSVTVG